MKINILDIISKYVKLERVGPGYTGRCPFCGADGVTGFIVSIQNQNYRCRKCGATGGIFQFLLSLKGISLEEALSEVRETFNIPFDSYVLDSRWNEYLQSTDYQKVMTGGREEVQIIPSVGEPGKKVAAEREAVSYTELATFIRCPLEYKLRYRDRAKIYEPVGTSVNVGRFLHSVATQFLKEPIDQRNKEFIESKFREEMAERRTLEYIDELRRYQDPTIMLLLEYFVDKPLSKKSPHFRTIFGPFAIVGTADCLVNSNDGIQIIEFKEYDYREFEEDIDVIHYLQLLFYFFGLGGRGADISGGAYCFFRSGYGDEVVFSDEMIDKGKEFIQAKLQEITECQNFAPKLNALCVSCGYKDKCKLQIEARGGRI
jgi:hypothetical protein